MQEDEGSVCCVYGARARRAQAREARAQALAVQRPAAQGVAKVTGESRVPRQACGSFPLLSAVWALAAFLFVSWCVWRFLSLAHYALTRSLCTCCSRALIGHRCIFDIVDGLSLQLLQQRLSTTAAATVAAIAAATVAVVAETRLLLLSLFAKLVQSMEACALGAPRVTSRGTCRE